MERLPVRYSPEPDFDDSERIVLPTLRELVAPLFRHRRLVAGVFVAACLAVVTYLTLTPTLYRAEMKLLVKRERVDSLVSGDRAVTAPTQTQVSEEELYSQVELLRSRDLLQDVATAAGLVHTPAAAGDEQALSRARVRAASRLRSRLAVTPVKRTTMIQVSYQAEDPQQAAHVLSVLSNHYLEKHLAIHRPPGAYQFFRDQSARLRAELRDAQDALAAFAEREAVVSAADQKEATLETLSRFESELQQAQAAAVESRKRIGSLERELASAPARYVTQMRTGDNAALTRDVRARILEMELKRSQLLQKFTPAYRGVVELDEQLAQARAALAAAEQAPVRDEVTDRNPTRVWIEGELARVRTERDAQLARAAALRASIAEYRGRAQVLDGQESRQRDLERAVKAAEESYVLYQRKQEEARISDELDRQRIANVAVLEAPVPPLRPVSRHTGLVVLGALLAAILASVVLSHVADRLQPSLRTPHDVRRALGVPVLASLPAAD